MKSLASSYEKSHGWSTPLPATWNGPTTLVLAFGSPSMRDDADGQRAWADLRATFGQSVVIGCSTAGEISGQRVQDASLSLAVACFDHTRLRRASTPLAGPADSGAAGERIARQLVGEDLCAVLVLTEGLAVNGSPLVAALTRGLPSGVVITGGLAGDGSDFRQTWVLDEFTPRSGVVTAVGFYGSRLRVGHGCRGGWSDFGPERLITRAEGNVLFELDGGPALDLYKTYLGEMAEGLPGAALLFPLAVQRAGDAGVARVRTVLSIDEVQRSLTFAGDIPQGGTARLMRAKTENLIDGAGDAAAMATVPLDGTGQALVVTISCVGRRLVLGERTEEEVEAAAEAGPAGATQVGFYSYGEISPAVQGGLSELHNQTMTVTAFAEH